MGRAPSRGRIQGNRKDIILNWAIHPWGIPHSLIQKKSLAIPSAKNLADFESV